MEKHQVRPESISPDQVDGAVDVALERIEEANELSQEDLGKANGGAVVTSGFFPVE